MNNFSRLENKADFTPRGMLSSLSEPLPTTTINISNESWFEGAIGEKY